MMRLSIAFPILVFLTGCSMTPEEALSKLDKGMTPAEVTEALGDPDTDTPLADGGRIFVYEVSEGYVTVHFVEGKVETYRRTDRVVFR